MIPFAFLNNPTPASSGTGGGGANLDLSNLVISAGTLVPLFAAGTLSYTVSVSNGVTSLTVTPSTAGTATISVNGIPVPSGAVSGSINLSVGANSILVKTDGGGGNTKTYGITVTRAAAAGNTPPNPSGLEYNFGHTFGSVTLSVSVSNPNAQDMVISFNAWTVAGVTWVTAFPVTIPAGATVQLTANRVWNNRFGNPAFGTIGGTWSCGSDSGTLSANAHD